MKFLFLDWTLSCCVCFLWNITDTLMKGVFYRASVYTFCLIPEMLFNPKSWCCQIARRIDTACLWSGATEVRRITCDCSVELFSLPPSLQTLSSFHRWLLVQCCLWFEIEWECCASTGKFFFLSDHILTTDCCSVSSNVRFYGLALPSQENCLASM